MSRILSQLVLIYSLLQSHGTSVDTTNWWSLSCAFNVPISLSVHYVSCSVSESGFSLSHLRIVVVLRSKPIFCKLLSICEGNWVLITLFLYFMKEIFVGLLVILLIN